MPRLEEHGALDERYRIYAAAGRDLTLLATAPDPASVGVAICRIHEDQREVGRRFADLGVLGVLDGHRREWVVLPFTRSKGT